MKKEILAHFTALVLLFVSISVIKKWLPFDYVYFWLGGIVGTILPDIDHLIYVYLLNPGELTSMRVNRGFVKGEVWSTLELLAVTRSERTSLIFHSIIFQGVFLLLTLFVVSSANSLLGKGIVIAFVLHLTVDQLLDLLQLGHINNWFRNLPFALSKEQVTIYWVTILIVILLFGFLL